VLPVGRVTCGRVNGFPMAGKAPSPESLPSSRQLSGSHLPQFRVDSLPIFAARTILPQAP